MKNDLKKERILKSCVVLICLVLTGCGTIGLAQEAAFESAYENVAEEEEVDIYTSEARGVLKAVNQEDGTFTVYLTNGGEEKTLSYDGTTTVQDRFGSALTMAQLMPGEVISIAYNSNLEKAGSIEQASDVWSYDGINKYYLNVGNGTLQIGNDVYGISRYAKAFSGEDEIILDEILSQDTLTVKGEGHDIVSIIVETGHGYLNLINDEALVGGWIEVGQSVIQQISDGMLLTVPEGSYMVQLTANGINETREVNIFRNQETILDVGDIEMPPVTNGKVIFSVTPENANVQVDGVDVDTSYGVLLPLGLHQVTASLSGYDTVAEYFEVKEETTTVRLTLHEASEETSGDITVSGNEISETDTDTGCTITIDAPEDVEVYQDNRYMGIAPVTYDKVSGEHTITLRRIGYITKSYNIVVEDDGKDVTYSFPDLEPADEEKAQTVSGNSITNVEKKTTDRENKITVSGNKTTVSGNNATVSGNDITVSGNN